MIETTLKSDGVIIDINFELSVLESLMVDWGVDNGIYPSTTESRWIEIETSPDRTIEEITASIIELNDEVGILDEEEIGFIRKVKEINYYPQRIIDMLRAHKCEDDNLFPDVDAVLSPEELSEREEDIARAMQILWCNRILVKLADLVFKHFK